MPQIKDYCYIFAVFALMRIEEAPMKPGDSVIVLDVHDKKLVRAVVDFAEGVVYVSRPEEVQKAFNENHDPSCIGFRISDVISNTSHK